MDNLFARAWLAHLLLAALSNEAIAKAISLHATADNLMKGRADLSLEQTLDIPFQSAVVDDAHGQANQQDKLRQELAQFVADPAVRAGLFRLAAILWTPITAEWEPWLRDRFTTTVAAAAHQALLNLCPELDADSLVCAPLGRDNRPGDHTNNPGRLGYRAQRVRGHNRPRRRARPRPCP
ncbi:MAG: hypothetical protein WA709_36790 [Stellaceae bacterium]